MANSSKIRDPIESLGGAVTLVAEAEPADRCLVYEAADLQVLHDHRQNQRGTGLDSTEG